MKRNTQESATAVVNGTPEEGQKGKRNGTSTVDGKAVDAKTVDARAVGDDLSVILASLQTMRDGDFSVRLPGSWTGLAGKIADTFNDIVAANQQMAQELKRVGQVVGKEGTNPRAYPLS